MTGINIFDIVDQNYGRLDEAIQFANDNGLGLNDEISGNLTVNDYEGDIKNKEATRLQNFTFNNNYVTP